MKPGDPWKVEIGIGYDDEGQNPQVSVMAGGEIVVWMKPLEARLFADAMERAADHVEKLLKEAS